MPTPAPHPDSYWVRPGRLLAGEYPGAPSDAAAAARLGHLLEQGIDFFLDLTGPGELHPYETVLHAEAHARGLAVEYRRIPIRDMGVPETPEAMIGILDALDDALARGRTAYVHCWGGVGRTGTVVGCHLARHGDAGEAALTALAGLWRQMAKSRQRAGSPETDEQRAYVRGWAEAPRAGADRLSAATAGIPPRSRRDREHVRGCLLGGAVGDALGAPVEFLSIAQIRARFGPDGIRDYAEAYGRAGAITDDTQMTLFTAEGILRAAVRADERGICAPEAVVHHAYVRWLWTQGERSRSQWPRLWEDLENGGPDGWLAHLPALHARRAPGNTCLDALRGERMGTREEPLNDSKGCGGVMRVAPVGLLPRADAFDFGCEVAALTHGHPTGYLSAGFLALVLRRILEGAGLRESLEEALGVLERQPRHEETSRAVRRAMAASVAGPATAETVESLGAGWVAEEALAIAVYCALAAEDDFETGIRLAVNHSGDSDSTGAITGNLLGALLGESAIPQRWLAGLELRREIEEIADDLLADYQGQAGWWERYPGW